MTEADPLLQLVCAVLVLLLPVGVLLLRRPVTRGAAAAGAGVALVAAGGVAAWGGMLGLAPDAPARILDAALAVGVALTVAVLLIERLGVARGVVIAVLWGTVVLAPLLLLAVGVIPAALERVIGAVDFAGVLATHGSAAALLAVAALAGGGGGRSEAGGVPGDPLGRGRATVGAVLITVAVGAWMLGVERVLSEASGRILLNAVIGCALGGIAWVLMALVIGRERPPGGVALGVVLGWGAIGAGVPALSPMALAAAALLGTAAGAAFMLRRRETSSPARRGSFGVLLSVAVGGILTALLADGFGLAATGSVAGVGAQLAALVIVVAATLIVMLPVILIVRVAMRPR